MTTKDVKNGKHAANTDEFWEEIADQFRPEFYDEPVFVLSPKQSRMLKMAYMKVPKFEYILEKMKHGHELYPIDKKMFEENIFEWSAMGFIDHESLEEKYKTQLKLPEFLEPLPKWDEHINRLKQLIKDRNLSLEFAKLWTAYVRRAYLINYLNVLTPYRAACRSMEEGEDYNEVEKYIFALWVFHHQEKRKVTKTKLATNLSHKLAAIIKENEGKKTPWYFTNYNALIMTKDNKRPLLKNITDMNNETIKEYVEDGFFSLQDFPELFSVP